MSQVNHIIGFHLLGLELPAPPALPGFLPAGWSRQEQG